MNSATYHRASDAGPEAPPREHRCDVCEDFSAEVFVCKSCRRVICDKPECVGSTPWAEIAFSTEYCEKCGPVKAVEMFQRNERLLHGLRQISVGADQWARTIARNTIRGEVKQ